MANEKELAILGLGHHGRMETIRRTKRPAKEEYRNEAFARYAEAGFEEIEIGGFGNEVPIVRGKYDGKMHSFYGIPYGLTFSWAMTEALSAAEAAVGVGFCGAISPEIKHGTMMIAKAAAISSAVTPDETWKEKLSWGKSDKRLADALVRKAQQQGYGVMEGNILTLINTAYETEDFCREARENGFSAVEMETAALYQIANYTGTPIAAMLMVSDNVTVPSGRHFVELVHELEDRGEHVKMEDIAREALLEVFKD